MDAEAPERLEDAREPFCVAVREALGQASVCGGTETAFYPSTRMRPQSLTRLLWLVALVVGCNYVFALIASR